MLLSTAQVAEFLGVQRCNVNYYIRKGYLKATVVDGNYKIDQKDYYSFRDEYFDTNKRFTNRGQIKKLTKEQINIITNILNDLQDDSISLNEFKNKYKYTNIPGLEHYILYKRDACIRYDYKNKGYRYKHLSKIYNLSIIQIQRIVSEEKKEKYAV